MTWELIRVLFPRWNFFDRLGFRLELEVKTAGGRDWQPLPFVATRTFGGLFVNPTVTRMHAERTLLETFVEDVQKLVDPYGQVDSTRLQKLTTFKMVRSLVASRLAPASASSSADQIQFRVSAVAGDETAVLYVSDSVGARA